MRIMLQTVSRQLLPLTRFLLVTIATLALACDPTTAPSDHVVARVDVSPSARTLEAGEQLELSASPRNGRGRPVEGKQVIWSSDDEATAIVSPNGLVTALAPGAATITATVDDRSGTALVSVVPRRVARIVMSVSSLGLRATEEASLVATPVDRDEQPLDRPVTWESANLDVAVVAPDGYVRAVRPGQTTITASSGAVKATLPVTVTEFTAYDLLFSRATIDRTELFVADLNGNAPRRLLAAGTAAGEPAASPDGSRIAFVVLDSYEVPDGAEGDIYVVNRDGSGLTRLTATAGLEHQPAWSPDGTRLVYTHVTNGRGDIWVMNADGSDAVNLTPDAVLAAGDERHAAWSHDGTRIAYTSTISGGTELWVMQSNGEAKTRLTFTPDYEADPAWSPNGHWLAFTQRDPGGNTDLVVVTVDGQDYVRLELPGEQESPEWSPDSRLIAFSSNHLPLPGLFAFHIISLDVVRHTHGDHRQPTWLKRP